EFEEAITEQNLDFSIHNQALGKMSYDELVACVQQLPETSRTVFNLYVFENYSHKQIAELLNMKEGTSHWHLNFARNKLKTLIDRDNY
ncbi:MAG: sigma-70 family RNA polymerase sigma factor, partial [Bacteroidales bacterium]|nr:sigma-70 family RNA polymerase sigma factor [Bacteroidales bacterium]